MSWAQYWEWKKPIADADRFAAWSRDVEYLHRYMATPGVHLPREIPALMRVSPFEPVYYWLSKPSYYKHLPGTEGLEGDFRWGAVFCPEPIPFPPLVIRGPHDSRDNPIFTPTEVAFNGDYETGDFCEDFRITLDHLKAPHWKGISTNMHPYEILVRSALVRLCHYFPTVRLSSDHGKIGGFMIPVEICRYVFEDNNATPLWSYDFIDKEE